MSLFGRSKQDIPVAEGLKIPGGVRGNIKTLKYMNIQARRYSGLPFVREFAINILNKSRTTSHNHIDEAVAIGEFVKSHVRYLKDPVAIELLQSPVKMINDIYRDVGRGDCDDMSLFTATLLLSVGIQPFFKIVKYRETSSGYNHIYTVVYETNFRDKKKTRMVLDCIVRDKPMGFEVNHHGASSKEFKVY